MTFEIAFLPVGNADCIIVRSNESTVIIDIGNPRLLDKWLKNKQRNNINQIYITHAHRDHFPQLVKLVQFLAIWIERGQVKRFILPHSVYKDAWEKLERNRNSTPDYRRLEDALKRLDDWDRKNIIRILPASRDSNPYSRDSLKIDILHPRVPFIEKHLAQTSSRLNEISLVLRITYNSFAALLLADIEGEGLKECLEICHSDELSANVVKIPHHGAYPKNGEDLKQLLEKIDAEIAILSVGSTNTYGHVMPELFSLLLNLQNDSSKRLDKFICTEVTRTCIYSKSKCLAMKKKGLDKQQKCAGEITIIAQTPGHWNLKTETNHEDIISQLQYPACRGKAEITQNLATSF